MNSARARCWNAYIPPSLSVRNSNPRASTSAGHVVVLIACLSSRRAPHLVPAYTTGSPTGLSSNQSARSDQDVEVAVAATLKPRVRRRIDRHVIHGSATSGFPLGEDVVIPLRVERLGNALQETFSALLGAERAARGQRGHVHPTRPQHPLSGRSRTPTATVATSARQAGGRSRAIPARHRFRTPGPQLAPNSTPTVLRRNGRRRRVNVCSRRDRDQLRGRVTGERVLLTLRLVLTEPVRPRPAGRVVLVLREDLLAGAAVASTADHEEVDEPWLARETSLGLDLKAHGIASVQASRADKPPAESSCASSATASISRDAAFQVAAITAGRLHEQQRCTRIRDPIGAFGSGSFRPPERSSSSGSSATQDASSPLACGSRGPARDELIDQPVQLAVGRDNLPIVRRRHDDGDAAGLSEVDRPVSAAVSSTRSERLVIRSAAISSRGSF